MKQPKVGDWAKHRGSGLAGKIIEIREESGGCTLIAGNAQMICALRDLEVLGEGPPSMDQILEAVAADDNRGFCTICGEEAHGVEPDACEYECESCGQRSVYGAEELLIRRVP